jgi:spermidine/putrescine transport system permease protein
MRNPTISKPFSIKKQTGFTTVAIICFVALYVPILLLVFYSFNAGPSVAVWKGFSLQWYEAAFQNQQIRDAAKVSIIVALSASFGATTVATMAALATTRTSKFRGQSMVYAAINQPLMVPEIVTAVALLIFFSVIKKMTGYAGMGYLILAHTAFCIPFAYLPIRARLEGMDLALEAAASDLYASPWLTFKLVTLPLLWPGILAGSMLAFVVSLDDVVITEFVKTAGQDTIPSYMLGQLRRVVTPEINAISTIFLAFSVTLVIVFFALNRRKG